MDNARPNIIVWNGLLLRPSETFVRLQARAMHRFNPCFAGIRFIGEGSLVPREDCLLVNGGGRAGWLADAAFKLTGQSPAFRRRLALVRPSLLHAHHGVNGALALPLARSLDIPLVVTFHGADATTVKSPSRFSPAQWVFRRRSHQLKARASLFIAVSEFIKRKLIERGYPPHKIVVHYIGVDTQTFHADPTLPREPVVLFVGRLAEKKGCEYLIRAMERVQTTTPDLKLVVIGDGPLNESLQSLAASKLRNCEFLGLQSHQLTRQWMNRASILAAPSITAACGDSEGLPTVIVEAQAMGLPVVATRHAGIGEAVVHEETGLLTAEREVQQLSEHISRLHSDPELWTRLSINGRRQTERKFDIRHQTSDLEDMYSELIERHHSKPTIDSAEPDESLLVGSGN